MSVEQWRDIPGYTGLYQVSDHGRARTLHHHNRQSGYVLKQTPNEHGYLRVELRNQSGRKCARVHALVLEAFVGPRPPGGLGCHNNGIRTDNRLSNLRWDDAFGNMADKDTHGTQNIGSRNALAKLDEESVLAIRNSTESNSALAARYGVDRHCIAKIRRGATWQHVGGPRRANTGRLGAENRSAKLIDSDVRAIRASSESVSVLAARYGVGKNTIWDVRSGKTWGHVAASPEPEEPGPFDALFHHPRVGTPNPTPEQVAEMVRNAEARLERSGGVRQRPRRANYSRGVWLR